MNEEKKKSRFYEIFFWVVLCIAVGVGILLLSINLNIGDEDDSYRAGYNNGTIIGAISLMENIWENNEIPYVENGEVKVIGFEEICRRLGG